MCVYRMIADYGMRRIWPNWPPIGPWPAAPPLVDPGYEAEKIKKFKQALEAAKELDKAAGQPDCEDPKKVDFVHKLEARLEELEKEVKAMKKKPVKKPSKPKTVKK